MPTDSPASKPTATRAAAHTRLGVIGFGSIGRALVTSLVASPPAGHQLVAVLVRSHQLTEARGALPADVLVSDDPTALLGAQPGLVIEAAGHGAVAALGVQVLRSGADLMPLSIGALADAALHDALLAAAHAGKTQLLLPVGAIAGLDGLLALRQAGLHSVRYTSTKPPRAWLGTPADGPVDLLALRAPVVIFNGSARDAARLYPKNANLAAAVALAGLGFERTQVQLVADPAASGNSGRIDAEGAASRLQMTVAGAASAANAKTSGIVAHSVLSALGNAAGVLRFV